MGRRYAFQSADLAPAPYAKTDRCAPNVWAAGSVPVPGMGGRGSVGLNKGRPPAGQTGRRVKEEHARAAVSDGRPRSSRGPFLRLRGSEASRRAGVLDLRRPDLPAGEGG